MFPRSLILLTAASLSLIFNATGALADDEECFGCHAPAEDVVDVEYQVDPDAFVASIHAEMGFGCADCHPDVDDFPHEGDQLYLACGTCHD